jgi:4-amino-4-deoxy-L-arabinose transferase-like glycosyltransferase
MRMAQARWVQLPLASFFLGLVAFWPRLLLIVDEERYVSQALAFAQGGTTLPGSGVLYPAVAGAISNYPPGTSLLQAPFVAIGGWRAATVASALALVIATFATMRWLRAHRAHEGFALVVPGFLGTAFFGRIAMSDVPATALVALTGALLWSADARRGRTSLLAGLCAGLILLFREPVVLILAPLVVGAIVRRRCNIGALVTGATLAVGLRLAAGELLFGSPFYVRDPGVAFSAASLAHTLPMYGGILLVLLPGAALLPLFFRGERRAELITAFGAYVTLFLFYGYDSVDHHGGVKGLMLASRFMAPLTPLIAVMAADVWPRWYAAVAGRLRIRSTTLLAGGACMASLVAFAVHPLAARQESKVLPLHDAIQRNTRAGTPVITNTDATLKYLGPSYSPRRLIVLDAADDSLRAFTERHGRLDVVVLDRIDANAFRREMDSAQRFLDRARQRCELRARLDTVMPDASRLRVFELRSCR